MKIELNDLIGILAIVDLAATRGAFKGNELAEVGAMFNRIQMVAQSMQQELTSDQEQVNGMFATPTGQELTPE